VKKLLFLILFLPLTAQAVPMTFTEYNSVLKAMEKIDLCFEPDADGRLYFRMHYSLTAWGHVVHYTGKLDAWDFTDLLNRKFTLRELYGKLNMVEDNTLGCWQ